MKDPFMALKEIPTIISDPFNATIKTINGSSPLILINGVEINTGVSPILPKDIEYVEVMDVIPAKYLARGVKSIINIKLKEKRQPYIWTQFATRHEIPIQKGFGVGYFEIGNEKLSLYARLAGEYVHNNDDEGNIEQENTGYSLCYDWKERSKSEVYIGEILLKYAPSQNDNFVIQVYEKYLDEKVKKDGKGTYNTYESFDYNIGNQDSDVSSIFTGSLYYKHKFCDESEMTITAKYNNNHNRMRNQGSETFGNDCNVVKSLFKNKRNSGSIEIGYDKDFGSNVHFSVGSVTTLLHDRIVKHGQPMFKHSNSDEYLYLSLTSKVGKMLWMLSPGVQATWMSTSTESSNQYVRPRGSASATFTMNNKNSLQLGYTLTNESPAIGQLNPLNTSTDSLIIVRGNPALVPQIEQDIYLHYTFNHKGFYSRISSGATFYSDMITPCGDTGSDGVYIYTYRNHGEYKELYSWVDLNFNFSIGDVRSSVFANVEWRRCLYQYCRPMDRFSYYIGVNAWWRKFYFGATMNVTPKTFTDISTTHNMRPVESNVQVNYNITDNLYVALCLQGFAGSRKTRVCTEDGSFRSIALTNYSGTGFRPWILIRWTLRKNPNRKIKIDQVIESTEKGIRLK